MQKPPSRRTAQTIAVLAVCQLIGWGTTFDMLGVMGRVVAPELGLANEIAFAGLTVMMVVSALAGPTTGRWLVRYGASRVLAAGSLVFTAGLLLLAAAHGIVLYAAAWVVLGIGAALSLAAPTYTAVVEREGANARRVIATLMLFTGLSATIFWPVLTLVNDHLGWRTTFVVTAGLNAFVCLPLHLFCLPRPVRIEPGTGVPEDAPIDLDPRERRLAFLLIAATTTLATFVTFGLSPSLLEIFRQSGASPAFALQLGAARGVIGVSARFLDMLLGKRGNPVLSAMVGIALMLVSFLMLLLVAPSGGLLVGFILMYSFGSGIMAVARALLPLALFSPRDFGLQSARLSLPQNLANAAAPVVFTAILDRGGVDILLAVTAALAAIGLVFVVALQLFVRRKRRG